MKRFLFCAALSSMTLAINTTGLYAQITDSMQLNELNEVLVTTYISMNGIGHFTTSHHPFIYTGKKTEVILTDSLDANKAINNTRQILGRVPGLNIVESETGGFVANGIGVRGLNPVQSLEMNVRQNNYNVAADIYGYNETYYLPPMEAVRRIEIIKGASSLQYGAQMGGMVNYVLKEGSRDNKFTYSTMQTGGSSGLFNSYHAVGGSVKSFNYFGFINYRTLDGWRANSAQKQLTGFGKLSWTPNKRIKIGLEYSLLRNKIKMPGGLTDEQFEADSRSSYRSRNWVTSPWNILSASMDYTINQKSFLQITATFLAGERSLVWFSKLPTIPDVQDPATGQYSNREIDKEIMHSAAAEVRYMHTGSVGKMQNTFAAGMRFSAAKFDRMEEATGTNKSDFDLNATGEYEENYHFTTVNFAPFIENCIQVSNRFSITPGIRFESLESEAESEYEVGGIEKETETEKARIFMLLGLGLQYSTAKTSSVYANISQAYRPIDYAQLVPLASASVVDPDMKDPKGFTTDLGIRGRVKNYFNYDIGLFYLQYNNRIGLLLKTDEQGNPYTLRTNVARSVHKGIESYMEMNITKGLQADKSVGDLSIYNSFAWTDAHYTKGDFKGNRVEYAPAVINRVGFVYAKKRLSISVQYSHQSSSFGDAANTVRSTNPIVGKLAAYGVADFSASFTIRKLKLKAGVNNITDTRYFTQRTDEYPGPGIISSAGRSLYFGVGLEL